MQDKLDAERQKVQLLRDALGQIALNAAVMRPAPGWQECLVVCREALGATSKTHSLRHLPLLPAQL
jgi:hypothetical protein